MPRPLAAGRSSSAWAVDGPSGRWVIRVPIPQSGRAGSYRSEARIGALLAAAGHPVAPWLVVDVNGTECSLAPLLRGDPVDYRWDFGPDFATALGRLLGDLHGLEVEGFGPLSNDDARLRGMSGSMRSGIVARWCHARVWPFDNGVLSDHPVAGIDPDAQRAAEGTRDQILAAAGGPVGVVHADLHRQHLLRDHDGGLAAVLDFGASFVGVVAWDFALLHHYYGEANARRVAAGHPAGPGPCDQGRYLAVAVGLYKLARNPSDPTVLGRLRRTLRTID